MIVNFVGELKLEIGHWSLVIGHWSLVIKAAKQGSST